MDRPIKQEPLFEEEGTIADTGGLSMSSWSISIKNEASTFHSDNVAGPSIKPDPETLGLGKSEDIPTSHTPQAARREDNEPEESLSDEGIGRSPAPSEYVVQSPSEEEAGTSSTSLQYTQQGVVDETQVDKQLFHCNNCGMAFTGENHLLRHMKIHTFVCQFCGMQFASDLELLEHEDIHKNVQEHCCDECNLIFDSKAELEQHYGNHVYACSWCPKTFTNNIALLNHEQSHQDPGLNCSGCGKSFKRLSNLNVHKQKFCSARGQVDSYQNVGPKDRTKQRKVEEATKHGNREENERVNFVERDDGWEPDDGSSAEEKVLTHKRGSDMYFHCSECPQAFSSSEDFARHELIHSGTSGSVTNGTIQSSRVYTDHGSAAYSDGFECKDCETTYPSLAALQNHFLKHKYPCDICDKNFTNLRKLKRHVSGHNLVFPCQKCQRQFKKKHFLKAHLEKVHGLCGKNIAGKEGKQANPFAQMNSGNQVVNKHSPKLSLKNVEDSCYSKNIEKAEPVLEMRQTSTFTSEQHLTRLNKKDPEVRNHNKGRAKVHKEAKSVAFQCRRCQKTFHRKSDLTMHMKRGKHKSPFRQGMDAIKESETQGFQKAFKCTKCPKAYVRSFHLRRHFKENHLEQQSNCKKNLSASNSAFRCKICSKTFSSQYGLSVHTKLGKHEDDIKIQCSICSTIFKQRRYLTDHMRRKHPGLNNNLKSPKKYEAVVFTCRRCPKSFHRKSDLTMHMRQGNHKKSSQQGNSAVKGSELKLPKNFKCSNCSKAYGTNSLLQRHIRLKHPNSSDQNSKPLLVSSSSGFRCKICSKIFSSQYGLSVHTKLGKHENNIEIQCSICSTIFKQRRYLTEHMRRKHPGLERDNLKSLKKSKALEFTCRRCPKSFHRKSDLTMHMRQGNHKKSSQQGNSAVKDSELKLPKNFKCTNCSKAYSKNSLLQRHIRLKHPKSSDQNSKPLLVSSSSGFRCKICSKCFAHKRYLRDHARRKHPEFRSNYNSIVELESQDAEYHCRICPKSFHRKSDFTKHMSKGKHENGNGQTPLSSAIVDSEFGLRKIFKCRKCPRACGTKCLLERHIRLKHPYSIKQNITPSASSSKPRCKECSKTFTSQHDLKVHLKIKHGSSKSKENITPNTLNRPGIPCSKCTKVFAHKGHLSEHVKWKHPELKTENTKAGLKKSQYVAFKCRRCPKIFHRKCDLTKHMKQGKHEKSSQSRKGALRNSNARGHPKIFKCPECPKAYGTNSLVRRHMRLKHPNNSKQVIVSSSSSTHRCNVCSKTFLRQYDLKVHRKLKHKSRDFREHMELNGSGFPCSVCPKVFAHRRYLLYHIKRKHPDVKQKTPHIKNSKEILPIGPIKSSFVCTKCPREFARKCDLTVHLRRCKHQKIGDIKSHMGLNKCTKCPKSYSSRTNLLRHVNEKHQTSSLFDHKCPQCLKGFPTKFGLTMHMALKKHLNIQNHNRNNLESIQVKGSTASVYQCKKCPRVFVRQCDFTLHMKLGKHVTEKSAEEFFKCPKCPMSFTRNETLQKHMKKGAHIDLDQISKDNREVEREGSVASALQCSACSKSFVKQSNLTKHRKSCMQEVHCDQSDTVKKDGSSSSPMFKCSKCTRSYTRKYNLQKHMDSKHSQDETYSVTEDEEESLSGGNEVITSTHFSEKASSLKMAWKCPECGKHFASRPDLKRHQDTHVFMCNYCNRFFTTQKSLEGHACAQRKNVSPSKPATTSPSKPVKTLRVTHKCELCNRSFSSNKDLEAHQEQHTLNEFEDDAPTVSTGAKPEKSVNVIPDRILVCRFCDKVFTSLELVHNHERSHMS